MVRCTKVLLQGILQHIMYVSTLEFCYGYQLLVLQLQLFYFNVAKKHKSLSFTYTEEMKKPCIEADLVLTLIPLLESTDQEMLLHAGRAIGRICYDNRKYQLERILFSLAVRHYFVRHCNL